MTYLLSRLFQVPKVINRQRLFRNIATTKFICANYEGDGKTTVTILNREYKNLIMIDSVSSTGFRLNNNMFALGPIAVFPRTILQWNVNDVEDITPESLSLFSLLEPKIDIFVLGTGDKQILPKREIIEFFREKKMSIEILKTETACATFNFLNVERRCVAGAFIPPVGLHLYEDEVYLIKSGEVDGGGYLM